jgi:hypothetical protein
MNNIHAKDWAEDDWGGYSGMPSNPYENDDPPATAPPPKNESPKGEDAPASKK